MDDDVKTFDSLLASPSSKVYSSMRKESVDRMKAALLSVSQDDPFSIATALSRITILRIQHQVVRIVQYTELMDQLEEKLYNSIQYSLDVSDVTDEYLINKLLAIQTKLQNSIIESNKLLAPYLNMEQYPAFNSIEVTPIDDEGNDLKLSASDRNLLRENAGAILEDLKSLSSTSDIEVEDIELVED